MGPRLSLQNRIPSDIHDFTQGLLLNTLEVLMPTACHSAIRVLDLNAVHPLGFVVRKVHSQRVLRSRRKVGSPAGKFAPCPTHRSSAM